ncbi:MAG: HD-GYP domain-containing protein [Treponemataceae bacterium]|nr:HD-GYP domain-containing protein [Treponemataceae bacterium]
MGVKEFIRRGFSTQGENRDNVSYIFDKEERVINRNIIKLIGWVCLLGPILIAGRALNIFPNMQYKSLIIFSILTVLLYMFLYSITFFSKDLSSKPFTKYIYVFIFNCEIWFLSFCPGVDVKLGYLVVPIIACVYFNERFMVITNVLSYFTMVFSVFSKYYLKNIPSYINPIALQDPDFMSYILQPNTGRQWLIYNVTCMSIEFILFLFIQTMLIKKAKKLVKENANKNRDIKKLQHGLISGFANLVEIKDATTGLHISRVTAYTRLICNELAKKPEYSEYLEPNTVNLIVEASTVHDLGKIAIPDSIITKTTILSAKEFEQIKQHPQYGAQIIDRYLRPYEDKEYISIAKDIALYHHERWDGGGYPFGLKGIDIPLSARIMSVADVLDSLLSKRPYKQAYNIKKTYEIMKSLSGQQFDPDIVAVLDDIQSEVYQVSQDTIGTYSNHIGFGVN